MMEKNLPVVANRKGLSSLTRALFRMSTSEMYCSALVVSGGIITGTICSPYKIKCYYVNERATMALYR